MEIHGTDGDEVKGCLSPTELKRELEFVFFQARGGTCGESA